ncbi:MAG: FkbM family methyltransferase [Alphaproteobacteria bacterium]|nr:FkbM family methyltransferase [Alphaproteobacteria bacterium]
MSKILKKLKTKVYSSKFLKSQFLKYCKSLSIADLAHVSDDCARISYSQFGEDRILEFAIMILQNKKIIENPTYLDIGGNNPFSSSNSYFLHRQGYKGVVIEPNPKLAEAFLKARPTDTVLNIGIHFTDEDIDSLPFYILNYHGSSSFDKASVEEYMQLQKDAFIEKVENIKIKNINKIIEEYFANKAPTFISLDVEGIDLAIIKSFDFTKYKPAFWCIETADSCSNDHLGKKSNDISNYLLSKGYEIYADTYVNTIFIDSNLLQEMTK